MSNKGELGSHFTGEYSRLGVDVMPSYGLSEPVLVNALTGVMHIPKGSGREFIPLCHSADIPNPSTAIIKSLSCVGYRACRICEKMKGRGL